MGSASKYQVFILLPEPTPFGARFSHRAELASQAELLAIAGGLQKGVEDLLAGRIFHPQARRNSFWKPRSDFCSGESWDPG